MKLIINLILNTFAVLVASYVVPGVAVANYLTAAVVAVVMGIINTFVKPVLVILTLPINILTLGLFSLVINAALVLIVSSLVSGFTVDGFLSALLFSLVLSIVNSFLSMFEK